VGGGVGRVGRGKKKRFGERENFPPPPRRVHVFNGVQWKTLQLITKEQIGVGSSNLVARMIA